MASNFDELVSSRTSRDLTGLMRNEQPIRSGRVLRNHPDAEASLARSTSQSLGLLHSTLLPSLSLHSGLAAGTYAIACATDRADLKDWLWPSGMVLNAWWTAVGWHLFVHRIHLNTIWGWLSWDQKLLLSGATAWGVRLFRQIVSRSLAKGKDDARYEKAKKEDPQFWNKTAGVFAVEALFQALISLPFTLPFTERHRADSVSPWIDPAAVPWVRGMAIGLFGTGMALEVAADWQKTKHREHNSDLLREGVWSIVRHPNYLGDTLVHLSLGILSSIRHPAALLGPAANYVFLRCVGGDKENEANQEERYSKYDKVKHKQLQEWRQESNSFWPRADDLQNTWTWIIVGVGAATIVLENAVRDYIGTVDVDWVKGLQEIQPVKS